MSLKILSEQVVETSQTTVLHRTPITQMIFINQGTANFITVVAEKHKVIPEVYHLEADNSDPMLGFFSQLIKIYFLIWSY